MEWIMVGLLTVFCILAGGIWHALTRPEKGRVFQDFTNQSVHFVYYSRIFEQYSALNCN